MRETFAGARRAKRKPRAKLKDAAALFGKTFVKSMPS
jgi:hypothetical protein